MHVAGTIRRSRAAPQCGQDERRVPVHISSVSVQLRRVVPEAASEASHDPGLQESTQPVPVVLRVCPIGQRGKRSTQPGLPQPLRGLPQRMPHPKHPFLRPGRAHDAALPFSRDPVQVPTVQLPLLIQIPRWTSTLRGEVVSPSGVDPQVPSEPCRAGGGIPSVGSEMCRPGAGEPGNEGEGGWTRDKVCGVRVVHRRAQRDGPIIEGITGASSCKEGHLGGVPLT